MYVQGGEEELPNEQMEMDVEDEEEEELYQPFVQDMEDATKSIAEEKEGSDMVSNIFPVLVFYYVLKQK